MKKQKNKGGTRFGARASYGSYGNYTNEDFSDFFESMFGGGGFSSRGGNTNQ